MLSPGRIRIRVRMISDPDPVLWPVWLWLKILRAYLLAVLRKFYKFGQILALNQHFVLNFGI